MRTRRGVESLGAWPAVAAWVLLALVAGGPFGRALHGRSSPTVILVTVALWAGWTVALAALLVPRSSSLTAVRVLVPGGLVAVAAALLVAARTDGAADVGVLDLVATAAASVAAIASLAPWVAERFVDGSAYGPERRSPLRTPATILGLAACTWAGVLVGATAGPLLLASRRWAVGAPVLVVGIAAVIAGVRSLHQLARRWVVVVPAGVVLHDPLSMPEPQLFLRQGIRSLGPAHVGPDALENASVTEDLTVGASGLALGLVLDEPVEVLVRSGRGTTTTRTVDQVVFTPARPASVLAQARERRIPVT